MNKQKYVDELIKILTEGTDQQKSELSTTELLLGERYLATQKEVQAMILQTKQLENEARERMNKVQELNATIQMMMGKAAGLIEAALALQVDDGQVKPEEGSTEHANQ